MKLLEVHITAFRSVKEPLPLPIDQKLTVLIGANDHGKTNILQAVLALNDDRQFSQPDENWDAEEGQKPRVEYTFVLEETERDWLKKKADAYRDAADREVGAYQRPKPAEGSEEPVPTPPTVTAALARSLRFAAYSPPTMCKFLRSAGNPTLQVVLEEPTSEITEAPSYLLGERPRVELFKPAEQLMDAVSLAQLEQSDQEFMHGVFRYARIWEERPTLFTQTPATSKRLERASVDFTSRIRAEWTQGEDLTFKFQHAGSSGNQIELLINDPAVSNRYVRPSERSEGFSAFFRLSMRLLARTEANRANRYIFLFDEPGTFLHPSGQINLQRVFETLSDDNQIIYSTHSLFLINHNRPERNRVVSKDVRGTKIDQKPFLKNWRAVRDSLGLILAGNFFIADTTLLVEGESDALYVGALLSALDRVGLADVDLNLFSVQWAGNARDFEPMARLMLEEGRQLVAMVDGDKGGDDLRERIEHLNRLVGEGRVPGRGPIAIVQLPRHESTEDLLPTRDLLATAVLNAAKEIVAGNFRKWATGFNPSAPEVRQHLLAKPADVTLGKHFNDTTEAWFEDPEPLSKLAIARSYCSSIQSTEIRTLGVKGAPEALRKVVEALQLGSKTSPRAVFETPGPSSPQTTRLGAQRPSPGG